MRTVVRLAAVAIAFASVAVAEVSDAARAVTAPPPSASACAPPRLQRGTGEGLNDPTLFPPTVGQLDIGMLFVEFADVRGESDPRTVYDSVVPRVAEWYRTVSYGRLQLVVTPFARWLSLPGRASDYVSPDGASLFRAAVAAADADFDFSRLDALYFVLPFRALSVFGSSGVIIAEQPLRPDGAEIRVHALLFDATFPGYDLPSHVIHETGHMLGLPDLYVIGDNQTFHSWDIMANSSGIPFTAGMFAWHRWKLGWLDPRQIVCLNGRKKVEVTVTPLERPGGVKAIVFRAGRYAYVAEVRQPIAEDAAICRKGVLITEVDFQAATGAADIWPIRVRSDRGSLVTRCGRLEGALFGVGRGHVSRVRVRSLRFEVLRALRDGSYRIRVTRTK